MRILFFVLCCVVLGCQPGLGKQTSRPATSQPTSPRVHLVVPTLSPNTPICVKKCIRDGQILAAHILRKTKEGIIIDAKLKNLYATRGRGLVYSLVEASKLVQYQVGVVLWYRQNSREVPAHEKKRLISLLLQLSQICQQVCTQQAENPI